MVCGLIESLKTSRVPPNSKIIEEKGGKKFHRTRLVPISIISCIM